MSENRSSLFPLSMLQNLRFPQLFILLGFLLLLNLFIPDPIPFVDEAMLAILTLMVGLWRKKPQEPAKEAEKNVTPPVDTSDSG